MTVTSGNDSHLGASLGLSDADLIAEATTALSLEATPWEIGAATHPHPTLAEVIGEAALAVDGKAINF